MNDWNILMIQATTMNPIVAAVLLAAAFLILLPIGYQLQIQFRKTKRPLDFSFFLLLKITGYFFILTTYPLFLDQTLNLLPCLTTDIQSIIIYIALFLIVFWFCLPQTWIFYQSWKANHSTKNFTLMVFFVTLSFFLGTALYMGLVLQALS
ncbi:MAG: hypothetical protein KGJ02_04390 [Verrucomicrobiota bacterium]|nr:hypothetical protein [Verrucomicrobiota bacterium]